jgi:hypothetical protein
MLALWPLLGHTVAREGSERSPQLDNRAATHWKHALREGAGSGPASGSRRVTGSK